jgi:hypothetical protein
MSLLMPWVVFLFVGAFDWGFYAHALISVESAARVVALYGANATSGNVSRSASCSLVLDELSIASNVANLTVCTGTLSATQPVILSATCPSPSSSLDNLNYVQMDLAYQTINLIPIPGLLASKVILRRVIQMPMSSNNTCTIVS